MTGNLNGVSGPDTIGIFVGKQMYQAIVSDINSCDLRKRRKIMTFLDGKKTYLVALIAAGLAVAQVFGVVVPEYVYTLLAAGGLGALRVAVTK